MTETVPTAILAAEAAVEKALHRLMLKVPCPEDDEFARAAVRAALPHLAGSVKKPRFLYGRPLVHAHHPPACGSDLSDGTIWSGDTSRVTCTDCRIALAVAAERERIRQLATQHGAQCLVDLGPEGDQWRMFADLIGEES